MKLIFLEPRMNSELYANCFACKFFRVKYEIDVCWCLRICSSNDELVTPTVQMVNASHRACTDFENIHQWKKL